MKLLKKLFYGLAIATLLLCGVIIFLSFNPPITENVADKIEDLPHLEINIGQTPDSEEDGPVNGTILNPMPDAPVVNVQTGSDAGIDWNNALLISKDTYVTPLNPVTMPDHVSGKTGFQEIREDAKEVEEQEATLLGDKLDTGKTGTDYVFPALKYPYYAMLTSDMQKIYRQIYANAYDLRASFAPTVAVTVGQLKNVFEAVYNDHPELFWLDTEYACKYKRNGSVVEISLQFNETVKNLSQAKEKFDQVADDLLNLSRRYDTVSEKEQFIHDSLVKMIDYDAKAPMNQSAYSALVLNRTVCAGYARAFQYLMQQLDVPCYYCTGYSGESHAWNIIGLDNGYLNVDVTWADTDPMSYEYYNQTDAAYSTSHARRGLSVYLPACNGGVNTNRPLIWEEEKPNYSEIPGLSDEEKNLLEAGLKSDDVCKSLDDYYKDCLNQMIENGPGRIQFNNIIPESLWDTVENAYASQDYKKGYIDTGLKALGMNGVVVQLQLTKLPGGFYRIYHNLQTYL